MIGVGNQGNQSVAPFTGAWIEIVKAIATAPMARMSLPSRERGLKLEHVMVDPFVVHVAPFTGAWIEIELSASLFAASAVAPFTGAWIEMSSLDPMLRISNVAPFTGAWIEINDTGNTLQHSAVAPFTGAWIEMRRMRPTPRTHRCRSLHGSVD